MFTVSEILEKFFGIRSTERERERERERTHRVHLGVVDNEERDLVNLGTKHGQASGEQVSLRMQGAGRHLGGSVVLKEGSIAADQQSKRESISLEHGGIITGTECRVSVFCSHSSCSSTAAADHKQQQDQHHRHPKPPKQTRKITRTHYYSLLAANPLYFQALTGTLTSPKQQELQQPTHTTQQNNTR